LTEQGKYAETAMIEKMLIYQCPVQIMTAGKVADHPIEAALAEFGMRL
jgi:hypothetical protein